MKIKAILLSALVMAVFTACDEEDTSNNSTDTCNKQAVDACTAGGLDNGFTVKSPACGAALSPGDKITVSWEVEETGGILVKLFDDNQEEVADLHGEAELAPTTTSVEYTLPAGLSCCKCAIAVLDYQDNTINGYTFLTVK